MFEDLIMNVSIIICTHNRASLLKDVLESLRHMNVPEDCNVEIIVVNNACTDNSPSIVDAFSKDSKNFSVKILFEPRLGKTYALNKGIKNASGAILALMDDDHIISKGYMHAVSKAVKENPSYNLYCGKIIPNWDGTEPKWVHDNSKYPVRPFPIPYFDLGDVTIEVKPEKGMFIPGAGNLFIKKTVFQKIGPFSEQLGPKGHDLSGGEDIEFIKRVLNKGDRLLYVPEALQYHQVDKSKLTLSYVTKKAYFRSMAAYQFAETNTSLHICNIPIYLIRQAFSRLIRALFAINKDARRYYLVRLSAVLGEIQGRRKSNALRILKI